MSIMRKENPIHEIRSELLPRVVELRPGVIGTSFWPIVSTHITCGKCHEKYKDCLECPYCGEPTFIEIRGMSAAEIAIAEAAGIDPKNEDNWDLIEKIASVAREHYADY